MIKFLALTLLMILPSAAQAGESRGLTTTKVNILVDGWEGRSRTYYDCSYAKRVTKNILKKMGAQEIKVSCTGGLDRNSRMMPTPINLQAEFAALSRGGSGEFETESSRFSIKYNQDCILPATIFNNLLPHFEATNVTQPSTCRTGRMAHFAAYGEVPVLIEYK